MNRTRTLLAATLVALSGAASANTGLAGDITIETTPFVSSRTPAEVRAELDAYKKSGVNPWSRSYNPLAHFKPEKTREQVRAEFLENREAVAAFNGEDSGSTYLAESAAGRQAGHRMAASPRGNRQQ